MDRDTIAQLARLGRLELSEDEIGRAHQQIEQLLAHFDSLAELDTSSVEPSPYPRPVTLRLRPDEPGTVLSQDEVLQNAPASRSGQFLVPKVIDG